MPIESLKIANRKASHGLIWAFLLMLLDIAAALYEQIFRQAALFPLWLNGLLAGLACLSLLYYLFRQRQMPLSYAADCYDHIPLPALLVDSGGIIQAANQAAAQAAHKPSSELIGQPVHGLFHPPTQSESDCLLCQHIRNGKPLTATDFQCGDGHWELVSLSKLGETPTSPLIQLHVDISHHKQAEEQLQLAMSGSELGFWDWDYATGKHIVNQRWLDMLGLDPDELDNYVNDWARRIHPEDYERVQRLIGEHIDSGKPYVVEFRMKHKQGHWVWIQGSGAVVAYDPVTGQQTRLCGTHQDITARKQFENTLQTTFRIINQSTSVALQWHNAAGLPIAFATENVKKLLGYEAGQLVADHIGYLNLIYPDDLETFIQEIGRCNLDPDCHEVLHQPYRIVTPEGSVKWLQDRKVISRNEAGEVVDYQGLITDITQQRQQSSAIRNIFSSSQERNAVSPLNNLALLAVETLGADFVMIAEIREAALARSLVFCTPGKIIANIKYDIRNLPCAHVAAGRITCYRQGVLTHFPDASWLQFNGIDGYLGIPLQDIQQQTFGVMAALYRQPIPDPLFAEDILKLFALQVTAELERNRAIEALQDQKQRLIDAQTISQIGDWQWNLSDHQFSWSDEMYRLTGTSRTRFIPNFANFLTQLVHPEDRHFFKAAIHDASSIGVLDFRHRIVLGNGEVRHVHQRGKIIRDADQKVTGIQGTLQDITERLRIEQHLLEAKQQAEQATRVKSEFLANMSHEIRTPMNAIIGLVELCLNGNMSSKQRDYLERVETASHSLMTIIDDILDFSKMEAGKMHLESIPFLLEEMLEHVYSTMSELSTQKGISLIRPAPLEGHYAVIGDPQRLRQILINLIGNAIKFTENGKITVGLRELSRSADQVQLEFSITDTGIGMNAETQAKLFQAFSQGDSSVTRNYGGTGLGLTICKQLAEQMGGRISVSSRENVGSTFTFSVSLGLSDPALVRRGGEYRRPSGTDTSQLQYIRGARILLVEDNEVNRIVAVELLEQAQLRVEIAENGQLALEKLRQTAYDCVLMDIQMPVMDGYQTTRQLRSMDCGNKLPVIAMTANAMRDDRDKCLQAGMDDFISKPILPGALYAMLIKWILPKSGVGESYTETQKGIIPYLYGIDSDIGLQYTGGNQTVYRKILRKFATNHALSMDEIRSAFAAGDFQKIYHLVHSLKGLAGSLGAQPLHGQFLRLEEALETHRPHIAGIPYIDACITSAELEMAKVIASINKTLKIDEPPVTNAPLLPDSEIRRQLAQLLGKLQTFDSDADQYLDRILTAISDADLTARLWPIKNQIARYQFVDAAHSLEELLIQLDP